MQIERMESHADPLDGAFQALADPTRRAVVARLGRGPATVTELARPFEMALPSFLKHVRVLEKTGLIRTRKVGRVRTCSIRTDRLAQLQSWLADQRTVWEARTDRLERFVIAEGEET
jgi:DNA-binding transcriptional ArsR family regulator